WSSDVCSSDLGIRLAIGLKLSRVKAHFVVGRGNVGVSAKRVVIVEVFIDKSLRIRRTCPDKVDVFLCFRETSDFNFTLGGPQQHIGKADQVQRVACTATTTLSFCVHVRLGRDVLDGVVRSRSELVPYPCLTRVHTPVEVRYTSSAHVVVEPGIQRTV